MSFCSGLNANLKKAIAHFDDFLEEHIGPVITIGNKIKEALQSSIAILITDLIPGDWDEALRQKAIAALSNGLDELSIIESCKAQSDPQLKLECWITTLKDKDPTLQNSQVFKLISILIANLHDNQLKESMYDLFVQTKVISEKPAS